MSRRLRVFDLTIGLQHLTSRFLDRKLYNPVAAAKTTAWSFDLTCNFLRIFAT